MKVFQSPRSYVLRSKMLCRPLPSYGNRATSLCRQNRTEPTLQPAWPPATPWLLCLPLCLAPALLHPYQEEGSAPSSWPLLACCPQAQVCPALVWEATVRTRRRDPVIPPLSSKASEQSPCGPGLPLKQSNFKHREFRAGLERQCNSLGKVKSIWVVWWRLPFLWAQTRGPTELNLHHLQGWPRECHFPGEETEVRHVRSLAYTHLRSKDSNTGVSVADYTRKEISGAIWQHPRGRGQLSSILSGQEAAMGSLRPRRASLALKRRCCQSRVCSRHWKGLEILHFWATPGFPMASSAMILSCISH